VENVAALTSVWIGANMQADISLNIIDRRCHWWCYKLYIGDNLSLIQRFQYWLFWWKVMKKMWILLLWAIKKAILKI